MEDTIKPLIVMLTAEWQDADQKQIGAGIIVGRKDKRIYIATANHVVRKDSSDASNVNAKKVLVQFKWLPGEQVEGKLLENVNSELDLALLVVSDLEVPNAIVKFDQLGDPTLLKRNDNVYLCGNPRNQNWKIYINPDKMSQPAGAAAFLQFESPYLKPGHSGGALLDERFRIVGMARTQDAPDGEAVNIRNVLDAVRRWGFPVDLTEPNAVTSFHFYYQFGDHPGEHYWTKVDENNWVEHHPNGEEAFVHITGRTNVGGDNGTLLQHTKIDYLEYFIPDKGGHTMWLRDRVKGQDWAFLGEMKDVK
ncbi:MAG TPA: serine protease [Pyrinomonadaceae bacterium]